jgi:TonB family protein
LTHDLGGARTRRNKRKSLSSVSLTLVRLTLASLAALLFGLALGSVPAVRAQSEESSGRKLIRTQKPDYPAVLKNKGIGGTVRLRARVLANGTVANIDVLGGDAVLADRAANAVMSWKYAPAATPSNEIVTINFNTR